MRARRNLLVAAVGAAAVVGAGPAAATQPDDSFENATVVSGLSMLVERDGERLVAERETTYTIAVSNRGEDAEEVTVRVTMPAWLAEATPHDGGELGDGYVDWPLTVAPGEVTLRRLTGAYASPDRETAPMRVVFTACALDTEDSQPIVCATDIAQLDSAPPATRWWQVAAIAAVLVAVAAGTAAGALRWWRRRRGRQGGPVPDPGQPPDRAAPGPLSQTWTIRLPEVAEVAEPAPAER